MKDDSAARINRIKKIWRDALEKTLGNVSAAQRAIAEMYPDAGASRRQYYAYLKDDPEFAAAVKDIAETAVDFGENCLLTAMKGGNVTAIIFFLKCRAKHRGYTEKQEVELNATDTVINLLINGKPAAHGEHRIAPGAVSDMG